tara:strand:+ start:209 stop:583 length:375 start_codon:yes stop_codon:yes gene_type:complete
MMRQIFRHPVLYIILGGILIHAATSNWEEWWTSMDSFVSRVGGKKRSRILFFLLGICMFAIADRLIAVTFFWSSAAILGLIYILFRLILPKAFELLGPDPYESLEPIDPFKSSEEDEPEIEDDL